MFCLTYYPSENYLQDAEQFKISYNPSDRTLENFLQVYKDKSIIIDISDTFEELDAKILENLFNKFKNFRIMFNFSNEHHLQLVKNHTIPYFFTDLVTSIDQLYGLMKYNPTDMYICEDLCFSIEKISKILHDHNIKVRVFPNICQSSFPETDSILTFFIRPEDIDIYSQFVDIFELVTDKNHQQVLYKIYKQKYWAGLIKEIIPNFNNDLDNRFLMNHFGIIRQNCGKRCLYKPGSCDICHRFIDVAATFKDNDIYIKRPHSNS